MPKRAAYYRTETDKCRWHADHVMDAEIRAELLRLATEYIERAAAGIESDEVAASPPPPSLWLHGPA
jgi:hypothetical protein